MIVVVGSSYLLLNLYAYIWPQWLCIILSVVTLAGLVLALLATAVLGFFKWKKTSRWWMGPALICLAFLSGGTWLTRPMGRLIADWRFAESSGEYIKVVDEVRDGTISCPAECRQKLTVLEAKGLPNRTRAIIAARCDTGAVVVGFLLDVDAPLVHEGYVYKGYQESDACILEAMRPEQRWPYVRHVRGNWYHFSDQPGL
jgi:hypothetical protein